MASRVLPRDGGTTALQWQPWGCLHSPGFGFGLGGGGLGLGGEGFGGGGGLGLGGGGRFTGGGGFLQCPVQRCGTRFLVCSEPAHLPMPMLCGLLPQQPQKDCSQSKRVPQREAALLVC